MKNIIMAAGVALLMVGCGESEPSGKYQCELEEANFSFLIDSKNKTWDMFISNDGSISEMAKKNGDINSTFTLTHNKDTEVYTLVVNKKAESTDVGTFKYDSDNNALNFVSLVDLVDEKTLPFTCKKID